ncbi:protein OCTOPUS [Arachis duranensis]|uniref:Protein OCTOPUS n=1 Tax=Arachis duranensis TaxID=130453 RepID=A0A6P5N5N2_ARADU|nr:protein OCTOPUS [Arachis duranensis]XP_020991326.1 protein OCTOPUS [Arachis duranensis]
MNPTALSSHQPPPPPPPLQQQQQQQQQPQPLRTCPRHPQEKFTGFCPECLCERLAELNPNNTNSNTPLPRKPPTSSTAAAALRAIFRPSSTASAKDNTTTSSSRPPTSSFLPELRRTKSFSASKNEALSGAFEPQRRSCDVRARNSTLWNLFTQEAEKKSQQNKEASEAEATNQVSVVETKEEEEEGEEEEEVKEVELVVEEEENLDRNDVVEEEEDEIRALEEPNVNVIEEGVGEIVVEEEEQELKAMKDHIDLDSSNSQPKKDSKIAGSLWSAASVFSKKLQKWRQKQKMKKRRNGVVDGGSGDCGPAALPVEKPIGRQFRDTQSEIADYGFGRRSCDTDPRFSLDAGRMSLDAGRMSFDDPRYSFDEPRASWDGYLLGRTAFPRAMPTMLSVVEDSPAAVIPPVHPLRTDTQIPVEEPLNSVNGDDTVPGGTAQTREYYSDSSSRRRKSFERSNSMRRSSVSSLVGEMDELKCGSIANNSNPNVNGNAKVTPAGVDYVNGPKLAFLDRDLSSNSARDDCCSESFDIGFADTASVVGNGDRKEQKKSRRWGKGWSIWGLIHRKGGNGGGNKDDDDDRYSRANGVERSYSESWQDLRGVQNGDPRSAFSGRIFRSNSSVSWRNAQSIGGGSFGSVRRNGVVQGNGNGKKGKDEFVLERNRSARYSPNHADNNGLLRFYLTPMRGSRRNGSVKSRSSQAHSIARSVLRLY